MGDPDVKRILGERLELAQTAFETAKNEFNQVTSDIPSPLPHPDGVQNIKNAASSYRDALNSYAVALGNFNEFVLHGTVPEFLKEAIRIANRRR